jgi:hypothetical protein
MKAAIGWLTTLLGIVVCAWLLQQLVLATLRKEGFQAAVEPEERMSPEAFSYNLLQVVKGPIRRLSSQLLDLGTWKERWDLAQLSPVELARRNLGAQ